MIQVKHFNVGNKFVRETVNQTLAVALMVLYRVYGALYCHHHPDTWCEMNDCAGKLTSMNGALMECNLLRSLLQWSYQNG